MKAATLPGSRRQSRRIARRLPLILHWRESQGPWREILAETRILSPYGCLVVCSAQIKLTDEVMVWWLDKMRYSSARAVFRSVSASNDSVEIGLEFLDQHDFWGLDFCEVTPHIPNADFRNGVVQKPPPRD